MQGGYGADEQVAIGGLGGYRACLHCGTSTQRVRCLERDEDSESLRYHGIQRSTVLGAYGALSLQCHHPVVTIP